MNKHTFVKSSDNPPQPSELLPPDILELLGPPALVGSELPEHFYAMMRRFVVEFDPRTISEWFLVSDVVNINWEIARYRRVKATFISLELPEVASKLWRETLSNHLYALKFQRNRRLTIDEKLLAEIGLASGQLADITIFRSFKSISQIDNIIERLEMRRDKLQKELRTHKTFGGKPVVRNVSSFVQNELVS